MRRGRRNSQASMLAIVDLDERVPPNHPLRTIKRFADRALAKRRRGGCQHGPVSVVHGQRRRRDAPAPGSCVRCSSP
jgi:hypothetical protein